MVDDDPVNASTTADAAAAIRDGRTTLGIELGSTRIKACLVDEDLAVLATGSAEWDNELVDGRWTYSLDAVWDGLRTSYAALVADAEQHHGVRPTRYAAIGVSAMMHGYLAFDGAGELLVPFRTWRNTSTGEAAEQLSEALDFQVPLRWSIAHLYQAVLDGESHVARIARLNTLAGYVHERLTGRFVLGVGDASGMFPIENDTYDAERLARAQALIDQELTAQQAPPLVVRDLLPSVLVAGQDAGTLTDAGADLLDPAGELESGIPFCPPEGDAGTGMVATGAVEPRTGNVSVGTSIFAMVVLEHPLAVRHPELDVVTTPAGDAVAMVHCNNGTTEIAAWARVFAQFAAATGSPVELDDVYRVLLDAAEQASPAVDGLLATNFLSGEPVAGLDDGRPLLVRTPDRPFTLGALIRAQVDAAFATLALGMEVLAEEHVAIDLLLAHGGLFRTPGPAQRLLAAALGVPIAVQSTAGEGGAWGMAVLAAYRADRTEQSLSAFLRTNAAPTTTEPPAERDVAGFRVFRDRFRDALPLQPAAVHATRPQTEVTR
jgi:sugar (pentulose or hexulose) kinase